MPGAALFGLQNEVDTGVGDGFPHSVGFVADDGKHVLGGDNPDGSGDHMRQHRFAADFVQDFGMFRLKPRTFARRHDGDGDAGEQGWTVQSSSLAFDPIYREQKADVACLAARRRGGRAFG